MKGTCLVVGDIMLDRYLYGSVSRISPEAPIPIVSIGKETGMPGGAANVATNLRGLGLQVFLCGIIGDDYEGKVLQELLQNNEILYQGIIGRRTTVKTRIVGQAQQIVRIDKEDAGELNSGEEEAMLQKIQGCIAEADCIIISDYKKGVCTETICQYLIQTAHLLHKKILVDPKQTDWSRYRNADLVKPNFAEFCAVIRKNIANQEYEIGESAKHVLLQYELGNLLVTRSQYGMTLIEANGGICSFGAVQKEVYDVSGAGDTALAALAAGLCWGYSLQEAVKLANVAAGIAVSRRGTYVVTKQELMEANRTDIQEERQESAIDVAELQKKLQIWRGLQKKIVFTNGCFDILHRGHVDYLRRAKQLGDILIVGLNSDASVRRLKGKLRPVNMERDRAFMLKALASVDEVVFFTEDTPYELIQMVAPDILVKGGDYRAEDVVGREFAKEVLILPFVEGYSTSGIIKKMGREE